MGKMLKRDLVEKWRVTGLLDRDPKLFDTQFTKEEEIELSEYLEMAGSIMTILTEFCPDRDWSQSFNVFIPVIARLYHHNTHDINVIRIAELMNDNPFERYDINACWSGYDAEYEYTTMICDKYVEELKSKV